MAFTKGNVAKKAQTDSLEVRSVRVDAINDSNSRREPDGSDTDAAFKSDVFLTRFLLSLLQSFLVVPVHFLPLNTSQHPVIRPVTRLMIIITVLVQHIFQNKGTTRFTEPRKIEMLRNVCTGRSNIARNLDKVKEKVRNSSTELHRHEILIVYEMK